MAAAAPDGEVGVRIAAARELYAVAAREALSGQPFTITDPAFHAYLSQRIGLQREECVLVVFLNHVGLFLAEERFGGLHPGVSVIPARQTLRRAFDLDARRIVIAHNHPSGHILPSAQDIAATRDFARLLALAEISLEDHCIVSGAQVASMRALGYLG